MMANFTAGDWGKLFELFPGRVLRGERGTNKVITKGWNRFDAGNTVSEEEIEEIDEENPQINLGIRTGRGLVVVDIDDPAKEELIRSIVGRSNFEVSTPRGKHLYFRTDPAARLASRINQGIDLFHSPQGDPERGSYVVAPGSVRTADKDEKLVSYGVKRAAYDLEVCDGVDEFDDIAYRSPKVLEKLYQAVQAKVNPAQKDYRDIIFDVSSVRLPHDGSPVHEGRRNDSGASLVGQWIQEGLDQAQCYHRLAAWNKHNTPEPLEDSEIRRIVWSIWKTHKQNNPEAEPIQVAVDPVKLKQPAKQTGLPEHLHSVPGVLGSLVQWYMETAPAPHIDMAIQSALALGSVVLGRRYITTESNCTSLYFLTVAKSGTGKEYGKKAVEKVLEAAGLGDLIGGSGYTSPGAVFSELRDRPTHICIIDEFGKYLQACQASGNSQLQEAVTVLVEAFGRLDGVLRPRAYSTMGLTEKQRSESDRLKVVSPAITVYAMTTPRQFYSAIGDADIEAGMLGRFLVIESDAECQARRRGRARVEPPMAVVRWAKNMRKKGGVFDVGGVHDVAPKPTEMGFSDEAYDLIDDFEAETVKRRRQLADSGLDVLLARAVEISMRVAAIISSSKCSQEIDAESMRWAIDYTSHSFNRLVSAVSERVTSSQFGAQRQTMLSAIVRAGERGLTSAELKRKFRNLKPREHAEIMRALVDAQEVALVEIGHRGAGRKREAFVAIESGV